MIEKNETYFIRHRQARPDIGTIIRANMIFAIMFASLFLVSTTPFIAPANGQENGRQYSSYITPFPDLGKYRVLVLGDSLGEGLWSGLAKSFKKDTSLQVVNRASWGAGFSRKTFIGRPREFEPLLKSQKPDIIVISIGARDAMASISDGRKKRAFGTPRWSEIYNERLTAFLKRVRKSNIAVYWVGLPIMREPQFNENMNTLNELFREKAHLNNIKFIDTWNGFVDQYGNFSPFGPDLEGRVVRLRDKDGIRFTGTGYRKLAHYVEREIRRDLIAARSERNVPLAGDEDEQVEITTNPGAGNLAKLDKSGNPVDPVKPGKTRQISTRVSSSSAVFGEVIASDRASGLTLLSSITRTNDPALSGSRHTLPLTLRPYYRVLVKGEALTAKPGRSDNFAWKKEK